MKRVLPALILIFFFSKSFAEWDMMFCDSVDEKTNCVGKSAIFNLSVPEVRIAALLKNPEGLHNSKIYFEVYKMDPLTYAEELLFTEEAKTEANQQSVSQTLRFAKSGHYLIKARDAFKDYITSRELEIK